nr:Dabb family protein [uncultured Arsenicibacter sp.]
MNTKSILLVSGIVCSLTLSYAQTPPQKVLRHVVTVTFKPTAPAAVIKAVDASFKNLGTKLKMTRGYEWGIAPMDARNKDIRHVYITTFASEKDLQAYGASPEHQKHIKLGASEIAGVQAVDFLVEK